MKNNINLKPGLNKLIITENSEFIINGKDINAELIITIKDIEELELTTNLTNGKFDILMQNNSKLNIKIKEKHNLNNNAFLTFGYIELNAKKSKRKAKFKLLEPRSEVLVKNSVLVSNETDINIKTINEAEYTKANIENYIVALKDSVTEIEATGKILKEASKSTNHQLSKCITVGNTKKTKITPLLLIDNYDVDAGHGASIGALDESIMYYLNSRGITKKEALKLVTTSYLTNITNIISDKTLQDKIKEDIITQIEGGIL